MIDNRFPGVTLQQIEVFLCAAKHENFTRVAEDMHMTQASVSRNISSLETQLKVVLFVRYKRNVRLTSAGEYLAREFKQIMSRIKGLVDKAYELQKCEYNTIRIGDCNITYNELYLIPMLEQFEELYPDISVQVTRIDSINAVDELRNGKLDVLLYPAIWEKATGNSEFKFHLVKGVPPAVVMGSKNPLFAKENLTYRDFVGYPVVALAGEFYEEFWSMTVDMLKQLDFPIDKIKPVDNPHTMAMELQRSDAIAFMDRMYCPVTPNSFRYIDIEGQPECFGLSMVVARDNDNPYIQKLIESTKKALEEV